MELTVDKDVDTAKMMMFVSMMMASVQRGVSMDIWSPIAI